MTLLLALACTEGGTEPLLPTEPTVEPDPDVRSYWPDTFPPPAASRIVFFGDSITRGYGVENEDNVYKRLLVENNDGKWPTFEGDDLTARYGELEVVDVSRDGATTDTVLLQQLPLVEEALGPTAAGPTLVVGTIGGNDMLAAVFSGDLEAATEVFLANIEQITDFFLDPERFPDGAYLAITNVYEPTDGIGQVEECFYGLDMGPLREDFDVANQATLALAERDGWAWIDLEAHFVGHGFRHDEDGFWADEDDPTLWFQPDCIHPNTRGHHEVRRLFLAALDGEPLPLLPPPE